MVFLRRVRIRNFKSIATADVKPGRLSFLVGRNGAGKSNFLDALRFVADALNNTLDHALRDRGGINEVRRKSRGHPNHFAVHLEFELSHGISGSYKFAIGARKDSGFEVREEELRLKSDLPGHASRDAYFIVKSGKVDACSVANPPAANRESLYLVRMSGLVEFADVFAALSRMEVYNLNPQRIADLQSPDARQTLRRDGANAAAILSKLPDATRRKVCEYLAEIVPGVVDAKMQKLGPRETLEFKQGVKGDDHSWSFTAANMSDGTLRAFGVLLALFQSQGRDDAPRVVGIEEPETALHPAASVILLKALLAASRDMQILVTSHSPDLLDNDEITDDLVFAVENEGGDTRISGIDPASRDALRSKLFTVGELLRQNQIRANPDTIDAAELAAPDAPTLFGDLSE